VLHPEPQKGEKKEEDKQGTEEPSVKLTEEDVFAPKTLEGSLIKVIKNAQPLDYGYRSYITYDHVR